MSIERLATALADRYRLERELGRLIEREILTKAAPLAKLKS